MEFSIDRSMPGVSQNVQQYFQSKNLPNWKRLQKSSFYEHSLASIFENIFLFYQNKLGLFCERFIKKNPEAHQSITIIYEYLYKNSQTLFSGFSKNSEYSVELSNLSKILCNKFRLKKCSSKFHENFKIFLLLGVKLVILSFDNQSIEYKIFGKGEICLYFYVQPGIFYCLFYNDIQNNPFAELVKTDKKGVFLCGHPVDGLNREQRMCGSCRKILYEEEIKGQYNGLQLNNDRVSTEEVKQEMNIEVEVKYEKVVVDKRECECKTARFEEIIKLCEKCGELCYSQAFNLPNFLAG